MEVENPDDRAEGPPNGAAEAADSKDAPATANLSIECIVELIKD